MRGESGRRERGSRGKGERQAKRKLAAPGTHDSVLRLQNGQETDRKRTGNGQRGDRNATGPLAALARLVREEVVAVVHAPAVLVKAPRHKGLAAVEAGHVQAGLPRSAAMNPRCVRDGRERQVAERPTSQGRPSVASWCLPLSEDGNGRPRLNDNRPPPAREAVVPESHPHVWKDLRLPLVALALTLAPHRRTTAWTEPSWSELAARELKIRRAGRSSSRARS